MIKPLLLTLLAGTLMPALIGHSAHASESPRMVIADLRMPDRISAADRALIRQLPLVEVISERLTDSRSFRMQVRDDAAVQAILREIQIQKSPLAREGQSKRMGLDAPDYVLEPSIKSFRSSTRFEKLELLAGMYRRIDTASLELHVRITDLGGNVVFDDSASAVANYPEREATEEDKRRASPPPVGPLASAARNAASSIVDAIVSRINPITVLESFDDVFVIDRGRKNGFDENSRFTIHGPPIKGKHPNTGADYVIPGRRIGEARVVSLDENSAELEFVDADKGKVAPKGSLVRIKPRGQK